MDNYWDGMTVLPHDSDPYLRSAVEFRHGIRHVENEGLKLVNQFGLDCGYAEVEAAKSYTFSCSEWVKVVRLFMGWVGRD